MIIEQIGPKEWRINSEKSQVSIDVQLSSSTITNKFFIVTNFIKKVSEVCGEEFDNWFCNWLISCENEVERSKNVIENIPTIKKYVNQYLKYKNVDYSKFVDESKAKKNSILFMPDEIEKIIYMSSYLKVYSFIFNNENLKLGQTHHKQAYNELASELGNTEIISKIYDVIKTKTFRYNLTDKFMWEYIKNIQNKDIGTHVIEIFNFIMNYILVLCEEDKNPITYFVGVVDESVKWFLRSVYKGTIVYDDTISTEDIQGHNSDNLKTYSYNDTLGRLKGIAYEKIYEILQRQNIAMVEKGNDDEFIIEFHNRSSEIQNISPVCETLVFPVLSQMTGIPYDHLKTLSPEHAAVISVYMQILFRKVFGTEYKELFNLLNFYPSKPASISTTYKIKAVHDYINTHQEIKNFFGFEAKILVYNILSHFTGRISRVDFCDLLTGRKLGGIPLSKIELEIINFFLNYFAGNFTDKIAEMTKLMNNDF